jgi:hypothetical protein
MSVLQNIKCSKHLNMVRCLHVYRNIGFIFLDDAAPLTQCQVNQREMSAIPIRVTSLMNLTRPVMYKLSM